MPDQSTPRFTEAIAFAQSHEIAWPRDPAADPGHWGVHHSDPPPFNRLRGPVHVRGGVSGELLGRVVHPDQTTIAIETEDRLGDEISWIEGGALGARALTARRACAGLVVGIPFHGLLASCLSLGMRNRLAMFDAGIIGRWRRSLEGLGPGYNRLRTRSSRGSSCELPDGFERIPSGDDWATGRYLSDMPRCAIATEP